MDYSQLPRGEDDGLPIAPVGMWAREKYVRVWMYDQLFSTGMKNRWDERVYVDLFAGPGYSKLEKTGEILYGSPLLALKIPDRFDAYIFCEKNKEYLEALETRVRRIAPQVTASFIRGEVDAEVGNILERIPPASRTHSVLSFVFADPFSVNFRFDTIRRLATRLTDFLILLALHMDANRNVQKYLDPKNRRIADFLDDPDWRPKWKAAEHEGRSLTSFLAMEYAEAMQRLGYRKTALSRMYKVHSDDKNLPLYYLAFFSRNGQGDKLWDQVLKYTTPQLGFQGLGLGDYETPGPND